MIGLLFKHRLICSAQSPNGSPSHRFREMIKACIEASTVEFQGKPYGEVITHMKRAAEIIHQAAADAAPRFSYIAQHFVDSQVIKDGISKALEFIAEDRNQIRFDLNETAATTVRLTNFFNEALVANNREAPSNETYSVREWDYYTITRSFRSTALDSQVQPVVSTIRAKMIWCRSQRCQFDLQNVSPMASGPTTRTLTPAHGPPEPSLHTSTFTTWSYRCARPLGTTSNLLLLLPATCKLTSELSV